MKQYVRLFGVVGLLFILTAATIDLDDLFNYAAQEIPAYIDQDNSGANVITDEMATLGRVLFYDKSLSENNTISCASCHQQDHGFSDPEVQSTGLHGGLTGRHSMRLVNARFSEEARFFWDERASSLEQQSTQPIRDHIEMGFSGMDGDPGFDELITRLEGLDYYQRLFQHAFGDADITEDRMQLALSQFIRSIQSFDTKFDRGFDMVGGNNVRQNFPNYTAQENLGKRLFSDPPNMGGAGCAGCHRPPEFDIAPNSRNNGVIGVAGDPDAVDLTNTRSPSLRDVAHADGTQNGPFMHDGSLATLMDVVDHYDAIPNDPLNTNLDPRLDRPGPNTQQLNLSTTEKEALVAFLITLGGSNVYEDPRWSDPFDEDGTIEVIGGMTSSVDLFTTSTVTVFPNPASDVLSIQGSDRIRSIRIFDRQGRLCHTEAWAAGQANIDVSQWSAGIYLLQTLDDHGRIMVTRQVVKL